MSEPIETNVGLKLRQLREQQGLSLRALAQQCGLSLNAISRIERGEHSPTVSSLHMLATALKVPITAFFEDAHEQALVFVKHNHRRRSQADGITMESLGIGLRDQQLEPFLISIEAGAGTTTTPVTHLGEEFVYCIEGTITYCVNNETYPLEPGDSLLFEAIQPHCFHNASSSPAILVMVFQVAEGRQLAGHPHTG